MKVKLINVGRNNVNTTITVKNEKELRKAVGQHILSRSWGFEATDTPNKYEVVAGFRTVGEIEIIQA